MKHEILIKRVELLKAMDLVCRTLNYEDGLIPWLMTGVPDGADLEDYISCAEDEILWKECQETFYEVVRDYGKDGWYVG